MNQEPQTSEVESLEYIYMGYVRLSDRLDELIDGQFRDFRLLGAVGALLALWPSFVALFLAPSQDSGYIMLMGFLGVLFIVVIIGLRDILKQAIIEHYLQELRKYEAAIRARVDFEESDVFRSADHWLAYRNNRWGIVFVTFNVLFGGLLLLVPVTIMVRSGFPNYAWIYGAVMLLISIFYAIGAWRVYAK